MRSGSSDHGSSSRFKGSREIRASPLAALNDGYFAVSTGSVTASCSSRSATCRQWSTKRRGIRIRARPWWLDSCKRVSANPGAIHLPPSTNFKPMPALLSGAAG